MSKVILGVHDGHNSGASLSIGGRVVASVCEERITRRKNEVGYPEKAIDDVLRIGGVDRKDIDEVAYASLFMHSKTHLTNVDTWYRVGLEDQRADQTRPQDYRNLVFEKRRAERIEAAQQHLGIAAERIQFVEHHLAHLAAALFTAPNVRAGRPVLGFTCDGAGDNLSATVSICTDGRIERIAATGRHASLGKIYSRTTKLMGMTPWEHEYKVMGLAPYADPDRANAAAEPLRKLLRVSSDGLRFEQVGELSTNYCFQYLSQAFECVRFDTIAAATQLFTEEMLTEWVRRTVRSLGISDIVCGGGVFMNVKANMLVAELPEVTSMYVMPSAGDESLSIGACLLRHFQMTGTLKTGEGVFDNLYLGGAFERRDEERAIEAAKRNGLDADIVQLDPAAVDAKAAALLAERKVVSRCRGRMEWGARSLGNRSILADPTDIGVIERINRAIKQRDFWMPFAPSVLSESQAWYFDNPKDVCAAYMVQGFRTAPKRYGDLAAASHPRDHTIRPQVVTSNANPDYHALLRGFQQRTGRGAILNTSFNLHGYPIVYSPADAIDVLMRSGLEHLALNNFMISKRAA